MSHRDPIHRPRRVIPLRGERLAIRHGDVLLAVPTLHPATPRAIRQQVFELILRRLYGEACDLARDTADEIEHRAANRRRLANLMKQTPHASRRGLGSAA